MAQVLKQAFASSSSAIPGKNLPLIANSDMLSYIKGKGHGLLD
jgi:hypothetical protein